MAQQPEQEGDARLQAESAPPSEGPTSVLAAFCLLGVSAYFAIGGYSLPDANGWQTAPGMLPVILGASLFIMSAILLVKALRAGALRVSLEHEAGESHLGRAALAVACIGFFYFVLLAYLPFEVAAALFLFGMFWLFWPEGKLAVRLAISICLPVMLTLAFAGAFGLPMPGQGNLVLGVQYYRVTHHKEQPK
ncbi:MAG TPA: tripartite tricarboxylate transporter TctB family protein [Pseudolabrys sp.]|nr:tripartite tricarboxylate transporter TctB family protein [Pseudolabrys sp.]